IQVGQGLAAQRPVQARRDRLLSQHPNPEGVRRGRSCVRVLTGFVRI
ncbi:unnamed protein product, partial [marine sediment metagenome]